MLASVVVPSRGGSVRLPRLLDSLVAQRDCDWEAVVVLDGDIDDSASVIDQYAAHAPVRSVVFPENRGRAAALTAGFAAARGDVLIRMDDDLEAPPTFVAHHIAHHQGPAVGVIGMCPDVFPDVPYAVAYGRATDERLRRDAYALPPESTWRLWSGNVSVTRDTYERVGPYDEAFRRYGWEDVEWGYRLHRLGIPILIPPDVEALHHNPPLTATERAERAFESDRSRRAFLQKHPDALETALPRPSNPWEYAVAALATGMRGPRAVTRLGRIVDATVDRNQGRATEKLVALYVQAAARAGRR